MLFSSWLRQPVTSVLVYWSRLTLSQNNPTQGLVDTLEMSLRSFGHGEVHTARVLLVSDRAPVRAQQGPQSRPLRLIRSQRR